MNVTGSAIAVPEAVIMRAICHVIIDRLGLTAVPEAYQELTDIYSEQFRTAVPKLEVPTAQFVVTNIKAETPQPYVYVEE